jgi:hypothetical protein
MVLQIVISKVCDAILYFFKSWSIISSTWGIMNSLSLIIVLSNVNIVPSLKFGVSQEIEHVFYIFA